MLLYLNLRRAVPFRRLRMKSTTTRRSYRGRTCMYVASAPPDNHRRLSGGSPGSHEPTTILPTRNLRAGLNRGSYRFAGGLLVRRRSSACFVLARLRCWQRPLALASVDIGYALITTTIPVRFDRRSTHIRLQFDRATTIRRPILQP